MKIFKTALKINMAAKISEKFSLFEFVVVFLNLILYLTRISFMININHEEENRKNNLQFPRKYYNLKVS